MAVVSIIVPVYNVEQYLRECVDSILSQSFTDFEVILVDDGSPDNCPKICDEYAEKDPRVKVIHKPNGGLSSARNAGLDIATGEFVGFVDSDDIIESEMYEKLVSAIMKNDADICFCRVVAISETGDQQPNGKYFGIGSSVLEGYRVLEMLVKGGCGSSTYYESIWNKLYRRKLFSNIRFPVGKRHEDAFVVHRIYDLCDRVAFIEDALYLYRLRSGSIMREPYSIKKTEVIDAFYDRVIYCDARGYSELTCYALLQALGKTLEVWMLIPKGDRAAQTLMKEKMEKLRSVYKKSSTSMLSCRNRIKLFFGFNLTAIYQAKLKIQKCLSEDLNF